jgi:hypothetical protein
MTRRERAQADLKELASGGKGQLSKTDPDARLLPWVRPSPGIPCALTYSEGLACSTTRTHSAARKRMCILRLFDMLNRMRGGAMF